MYNAMFNSYRMLIFVASVLVMMLQLASSTGAQPTRHGHGPRGDAAGQQAIRRRKQGDDVLKERFFDTFEKYRKMSGGLDDKEDKREQQPCEQLNPNDCPKNKPGRKRTNENIYPEKV